MDILNRFDINSKPPKMSSVENVTIVKSNGSIIIGKFDWSLEEGHGSIHYTYVIEETCSVFGILFVIIINQCDSYYFIVIIITIMINIIVFLITTFIINYFNNYDNLTFKGNFLKVACFILFVSIACAPYCRYKISKAVNNLIRLLILLMLSIIFLWYISMTLYKQNINKILTPRHRKELYLSNDESAIVRLKNNKKKTLKKLVIRIEK